VETVSESNLKASDIGVTQRVFTTKISPLLSESQKLEGLVVRLAQENRSWGYDRLASAPLSVVARVRERLAGGPSRR
jgi:hypothetical protein